MSALSHAVFNLISGIIECVVVNFMFHGRKMRLSASSQNSKSEKSIYGHFEVSFLNV